MQLTGLNIYPVKSLKGLSIKMMEIGKKGPMFDRRWMVVDEQGLFLTQRKWPKMALIETALDRDHLYLSFPDGCKVSLPFTEKGKKIAVEVWKDRCDAIDQGDEAAAALSSFLEVSCRLVYLPESSHRLVNRDYTVTEEDEVGFADGFPFLLISEASLAELNGRLTTPVCMDRFRPNLVISGCPPFEEDRMRRIRIGTVEFELVKPCSRCIVTTIDQATGEKGIEPLQTLSTYRKKEKGIMFGQNLIHRNLGILKLGDPVEVIAART